MCQKAKPGKRIQNGEKQVFFFSNSTLSFYTGKASVETKAKSFKPLEFSKSGMLWLQ